MFNMMYQANNHPGWYNEKYRFHLFNMERTAKEMTEYNKYSTTTFYWKIK